MKATDHVDYELETAHLDTTLRAADQSLTDLASRTWRPAGLGDEETALLLRSWADQRRSALMQLLESPYFGRIDVGNASAPVPHRYYIGQSGLKEPGSDQRLVIDWRAQAAAAFYRPGPEVSLKRRYSIVDRRLTDISDEPVSADGAVSSDPVLAQILAGSRGQLLRPIVATIQAEQDELIRAPDPLLMIQGGAGTGKTVVALHRLAYLLYFHRSESARKTNLRVAVFGPNRIFLSFVASVLPTLGESDVYQTTFDDWFARWCGHDLPKLPGWEQRLERLLAPKRAVTTDAADVPRARVKGSGRMGVLLERFVAEHRDLVRSRLVQSFQFSVKWSYRAPVRLEVSRSDRERATRALLDEPPNRARSWVRSWLWPRMRAQLDRRHGSAAGDAWLASPGLVSEARKAFDVALDERWPSIPFAKSYQQLLADRQRLVRLADGMLDGAEVEALCSTARLDAEDLAPLAYLRLLLDGPARVRDTRGRETDQVQQFDHVVVDEAQDLSPLQLAVIGAHTRGSTILGDIAQGVNPFRGTRDWHEVEEVLQAQRHTPRRVTLRQSYRSTRQIIDFANRLLAMTDQTDASQIEAFPRDGEPPRLLRAQDEVTIVREVAALLQDVIGADFQTAAVICKTARDAERFAEQLSTHLRGGFALLSRPSDTRGADVIVVPGYLAKGMDFDVVCVVGVDARRYTNNDLDARLLYVAATRALHRLYLFWSGAPSPLLPAKAAP
jgi:DNA helicase-2/ATP-dependent DNA helicase PcrA